MSKFEVTTTYKWWRSDGKDIPEEHKLELMESARERISKMQEEGYVSGQLCEAIPVGDDVDEYNGWWEAKEVAPKFEEDYSQEDSQLQKKSALPKM